VTDQPAVFATPAEMREWSRRHRAAGATIGFVPTMGALHAGHLALVADAQRRADVSVVSVFVNPLQFNRDADFDGYPRPIDDDVAACAAAGVDAVYAPTAAAMYPAGFQTRVVPGALAEQMEGPMRPGHFEGVTTVVTKLFNTVLPDVAVFGAKDFQQLAIITQMARDLDLGIEIVGHPIVREPDGLAMSSRNLLLDADGRIAARCVPHGLLAACAAARAGADQATIERAALDVLDPVPAARHEYTTLFDAATLEPLTTIGSAQRRPDTVRIATAVWIGDVRLIDNRDPFASDAEQPASG
jgi:pantoate--beta-alanine ligase